MDQDRCPEDPKKDPETLQSTVIKKMDIDITPSNSSNSSVTALKTEPGTFCSSEKSILPTEDYLKEETQVKNSQESPNKINSNLKGITPKAKIISKPTPKRTQRRATTKISLQVPSTNPDSSPKPILMTQSSPLTIRNTTMTYTMPILKQQTQLPRVIQLQTPDGPRLFALSPTSNLVSSSARPGSSLPILNQSPQNSQIVVQNTPILHNGQQNHVMSKTGPSIMTNVMNNQNQIACQPGQVQFGSPIVLSQPIRMLNQPFQQSPRQLIMTNNYINNSPQMLASTPRMPQQVYMLLTAPPANTSMHHIPNIHNQNATHSSNIMIDNIHGSNPMKEDKSIPRQKVNGTMSGPRGESGLELDDLLMDCGIIPNKGEQMVISSNDELPNQKSKLTQNKNATNLETNISRQFIVQNLSSSETSRTRASTVSIIENPHDIAQNQGLKFKSTVQENVRLPPKTIILTAPLAQVTTSNLQPLNNQPNIILAKNIQHIQSDTKSKSSICPSREPLQVPLVSKSELCKQSILNQLNSDLSAVTNPHTKVTFQSIEDACKRLLRYHVFNSNTPDLDSIEKFDQIFDAASECYLIRKDVIYNRLRKISLKQSMRKYGPLDDIMINQLVLDDEITFLDKERQLYKEYQAYLEKMALKQAGLNYDDNDDISGHDSEDRSDIETLKNQSSSWLASQKWMSENDCYNSIPETEAATAIQTILNEELD